MSGEEEYVRSLYFLRPKLINEYILGSACIGAHTLVINMS